MAVPTAIPKIKRAEPWILEEEPIGPFYADLMAKGNVEIFYKENGGLIVSQGTQCKPVPKKKSYVPALIQGTMLICGALSAYTLYRITFGTIPCTCTDRDEKSMLKTYWQRFVFLLGMGKH